MLPQNTFAGSCLCVRKAALGVSCAAVMVTIRLMDKGKVAQ